MIFMALRDRGKVKWQSAFMMPEHLAALKRFANDYYQEKKPILDQYEIDEIESKIHYAMEFAFKVKLKVLRDSVEDIQGRICRLDGINKMVYIVFEVMSSIDLQTFSDEVNNHKSKSLRRLNKSEVNLREKLNTKIRQLDKLNDEVDLSLLGESNFTPEQLSKAKVEKDISDLNNNLDDIEKNINKTKIELSDVVKIKEEFSG